MRILFTIPRLSYSGAPKVMAWVANQMAIKGHVVQLTAFYSEEQARILHKNVTISSLNIKRSSSRIVRNTIGMVKAIYRLHRTVKEFKPDVIVSFLDSVGYAYLPIGRLLTKAKFVVSERADPYAIKGKMAYVRFALMQFAHGTVFQTQGAQSFFVNRKRIFDNSVVIPNPVVLSNKIIAMQKCIPSFNDRGKIIVTVGRLSLKQKRQDVLLDAFKIFHKLNPEYKLIIYGDGPDRRKIQGIINENGLSDCVFLGGVINRVEEMIFHAAAFVLTSDYEGIPNALIEAMSVGVPSVSTDCSPGGAALLIRDGENGFLVPSGDAEAVADKLSILVNDEEIAERFSSKSIAIASEFSENVIAEKWDAFFWDIVADKEKVNNA